MLRQYDVPRRTSHRIGGKAAQTMYYAVGELAERIGLPLTHMVTINFASVAIDPRCAVPAFQKLRRDLFGKWLTRPHRRAGQPITPTYAYTFENVRDKRPFETMQPGDPHNVHVHWLLHLPAQRVAEFKHEIWRWVEQAAGKIVGGEEAIKVTPLSPEKHGVREYMVKGIDVRFKELYANRRKRQHGDEPQGIIIGTRSSVSRNLGPKARRALDKAQNIRRKIPRRF